MSTEKPARKKRRNYAKDWEIDHIVPISSFDIFSEPDKKAAFNFGNTQPLWVADNRKKYVFKWRNPEAATSRVSGVT